MFFLDEAILPRVLPIDFGAVARFMAPTARRGAGRPAAMIFFAFFFAFFDVAAAFGFAFAVFEVARGAALVTVFAVLRAGFAA